MEKELKIKLALISMQYGSDLPEEIQEIVNQIEKELKANKPPVINKQPPPASHGAKVSGG